MASLYDTDFYAWTQEESAKLRRLLTERSNLDLDFENIAEEIDSLGRRDRRQLLNRLAELDVHLMKLALSLLWEPRRQWKNSVNGQRDALERHLGENPSLRRQVPDLIEDAHKKALKQFDEEKLIELHMPELPTLPMFDADQMLDPEFWPETRGAD